MHKVHLFAVSCGGNIVLDETYGTRSTLRRKNTESCKKFIGANAVPQSPTRTRLLAVSELGNFVNCKIGNVKHVLG